MKRKPGISLLKIEVSRRLFARFSKRHLEIGLTQREAVEVLMRYFIALSPKERTALSRKYYQC